MKYEQNSLRQQTIRLKQSILLQSLLKRVSVFVSDIYIYIFNGEREHEMSTQWILDYYCNDSKIRQLKDPVHF